MVFGPASAATPAPSLSRPAVLASDALIVAPAPVPMAFTVIAGTPDATASVTMFSAHAVVVDHPVARRGYVGVAKPQTPERARCIEMNRVVVREIQHAEFRR